MVGPYYQGDATYANTDVLQGPTSMSWTFSNITPGFYYVAMTWNTTPFPGQFATNAPVTVIDGVTSEGTFLIDQNAQPGTFAFDGVMWHQFHFFAVDSNTVTVTISNTGVNGLIMADGVIVREDSQQQMREAVGALGAQ